MVSSQVVSSPFKFEQNSECIIMAPNKGDFGREEEESGIGHKNRHPHPPPRVRERWLVHLSNLN